MKKNILFLFSITLFNSFYGQTDACGAGSTLLTPSATCVNTAGNTAGFTDSNNGCANGNEDDEGFYRFVATATTHTVTVDGNVGFDCVLGVFNACGGSQPTGGGCIDNTGDDGIETVTLSGLTVGTTYFISIHDFAAGAGTFNICVTSPPLPPANDNCSGAIAFPIVPTGGTCANLLNQSTAGASNSGVTPTGVCTSNSGTPNDDVWFSFVATSTVQILEATYDSGNTDVYWQVFSGACGATMNSLLCTDVNTGGTINGLTIGSTYYVRLYSWSGSGTTQQDICIKGPPPPPANDNCTGAYTLTVNSGTTCTTQSNGTLLGATTSTQANTCDGTADDDVWYSFVATSVSHSVSINNIAGSVTDMYHSVYGGTCGTLSSTLVCSDPNSSVFGGLTIGATYFVRVYSYTGTGFQNTTFSVCVLTPPPPPANDNCTGAVALTVNSGSTCSTQSNGTLLGATTSTQANTCGGTADDDVWYSFVATSSSHSVSITNISGSTDMYHSVYGNTCGSLGTPFVCSDPNISYANNLTIGATYFVRVYSYSSIGGLSTTFSVCVLTPPPPPANDNCTGATSITVNAGATCTSQSGGTLVSATTSTQTNACSGTADDDVWYVFTATSITHSISINNIAGSTLDLYHSLYAGTCSAIGAPLICSDPNTSAISGLTIGNVYYIRVFSFGSSAGENTTFSVCVTTPVIITPTNDNCSGATAVVVNSGTACTTQANGTLNNALTSTVPNDCFGAADDDVWYRFVATAGTHSININNIAGSGSSDLYHSVYTGTCNSLGSALICSDPNSSALTGLTIGTAYYIRVFSYTTGNQNTTFSVCVTTPTVPPAPTNDNCTSPTTVAVNTGSICTTQTNGTLLGATASTQSTSCGNNYDDNDVWYSFVATSTFHQVSLNNVAGSNSDLYHSIYLANCASLGAALICSDSNTSTPTGLTVGSTYFVRVYTVGTTFGETATFSVCVTIPPPPPVNLTCSGMQPICSGSSINFIAQSNGGTAEPGNNYGCLSTKPNPTWFFMEILTAGTMAVDITAASDVDFAMWGPYASLTTAKASCGSYPSPTDCSYSSSPTEQANVNAVTVGQVYVVLVTNYANTVQNIQLTQAPGASATTNCAAVLPISLITFNATINDKNTVNVNWETASEKNNDYFKVEKSKDATVWSDLVTVKGNGNSNTVNKYAVTDEKPFIGVTYYRLKQIDFDGNFSYSQIKSVDFNKDFGELTNVYPNPTKDVLNFDVTSKYKGEVIVEILNFAGLTVQKEIKPLEVGINTQSVTLNSLKNGVYLLKITFANSGKSTIHKIIKN